MFSATGISWPLRGLAWSQPETPAGRVERAEDDVAGQVPETSRRDLAIDSDRPSRDRADAFWDGERRRGFRSRLSLF